MKWFKNRQNALSSTNNTDGFVDVPKVDPRWGPLMRDELICGCCNENYKSLLSIGYGAPEAWPHSVDHNKPDRVDMQSDAFLNQDLCKIDDCYFIRAVLIFPLVGSEISFLIGTWVEVSQPDFHDFVTQMPFGKQGSMDIMFCQLANIIPPFRSGLPCIMKPRDGVQRPIVHVAIEEDPLYAAQIDGLDFDQLAEILHAHGHFLKH
jgi:hypothetical protein